MEASHKLSLVELDAEVLELLPVRETLFFDFNVAPVVAVNLSMAINAASIGSVANSEAWQTLLVAQQ
ncbi:hypothetical protein [Pseudarthrobacter sulfonivorans]|uniref:hypothetical protein n=1 Tax=Pseudarthrobacter sulfonivorans TaxID=121292 RepID=UPI002102EBB8|nr:hypothetical protein [Pseudarthrobacter sulfonivorans]